MSKPPYARPANPSARGGKYGYRWAMVVRFLVREFRAWSTRSYNRAIQAPVIPSQAQRWMKAQGWTRD
jgi:hypothetical protein